MSLVPTYVQAADGLFYKNPTIRTATAFFCFDDDDPPELVSDHECDPYEILREMGLNATVIRVRYKFGGVKRCFTENIRSKMRTAVAWWCKLNGPIPVPVKGKGLEVPKADCVILAFGDEKEMLNRIYPRAEKKTRQPKKGGDK